MRSIYFEKPVMIKALEDMNRMSRLITGPTRALRALREPMPALRLIRLASILGGRMEVERNGEEED